LIRIGPLQDGGYLVPDDLEGLVGAISPGVSSECGFDTEIAQRGIPVLMIDASVDGPPQEHVNFKFIPKFLGAQSSPSEMTLQEAVTQFPSGDLLLQMDIERAEYEVLPVTPDTVMDRFRIIVIELHLVWRLERPTIGDFNAVMDKLLRNHRIVHFHINNSHGAVNVSGVEVPLLVELTLLRNDRANFDAKAHLTLPHPLDEENVPGKPSVKIPEWVYR
jgi:hypothetical protein